MSCGGPRFERYPHRSTRSNLIRLARRSSVRRRFQQVGAEALSVSCGAKFTRAGNFARFETRGRKSRFRGETGCRARVYRASRGKAPRRRADCGRKRGSVGEKPRQTIRRSHETGRFLCALAPLRESSFPLAVPYQAAALRWSTGPGNLLPGSSPYRQKLRPQLWHRTQTMNKGRGNGSRAFLLLLFLRWLEWQEGQVMSVAVIDGWG